MHGFRTFVFACTYLYLGVTQLALSLYVCTYAAHVYLENRGLAESNARDHHRGVIFFSHPIQTMWYAISPIDSIDKKYVCTVSVSRKYTAQIYT